MDRGVRLIDPCAHAEFVRGAALVPTFYLYKPRDRGNVSPTQGHEQPAKMISPMNATLVLALCVVYATARAVSSAPGSDVLTGGDVAGVFGSTLEMSCTFNGSKNVEWSKVGTDVILISRGLDGDAEDKHTLGAPPPSWKLQQDGDKSTLTIPVFSGSDVGTYECDFNDGENYHNGKIQVTKAD